MGRLVRVDRRAWMLCSVALLWAWEATADYPEPAEPPVSAAGAEQRDGFSFVLPTATLPAAAASGGR